MTDFPTLIRKLEQSGMTQREIAKKIGTSKSQVNRIKNHNQIPNYHTGHRLVIMTVPD